ncbi:hypothetical protein BZA05DRAFT_441707 [Tricharina praecox]|uniref:uncharacterized protein n=1 Tax=Tricharina praecox TaxID=43433 RepID=UPI0022210F5F|nr:uncharacterized protein BZA05DRAFT_441707 [Tricharina praecox]KAI5857083.1 hypothetical protein BZA05DRAFT_441707 [Tricharina praecox]
MAPNESRERASQGPDGAEELRWWKSQRAEEPWEQRSVREHGRYGTVGDSTDDDSTERSSSRHRRVDGPEESRERKSRGSTESLREYGRVDATDGLTVPASYQHRRDHGAGKDHGTEEFCEYGRVEGVAGQGRGSAEGVVDSRERKLRGSGRVKVLVESVKAPEALSEHFKAAGEPREQGKASEDPREQVKEHGEGAEEPRERAVEGDAGEE